jgi:predicted RNA binding protein YcfA (HicA-like mRNA interferase family)
MPKLPRIKDRELIRALKKLGFFEHPERGTAHLVFAHQDGRRTTVARHPANANCSSGRGYLTTPHGSSQEAHSMSSSPSFFCSVTSRLISFFCSDISLSMSRHLLVLVSSISSSFARQALHSAGFFVMSKATIMYRLTTHKEKRFHSEFGVFMKFILKELSSGHVAGMG